MAIQTNFPAVKPALLLDFANTKKLDPRIAFTRTTTATYYDGVTTAKAEENLFTYSQEFDNAIWGKTGTSVTANSTAAPDGTTTADTLTGDGVSGTHFISQPSATGTQTFSIFAKKGTNDFLQIAVGGTTVPYANFNLALGTTSAFGAGTTSSITETPAGSGWYRCVMTTTDALATGVRFALVTSLAAARVETNTLATTVFLWGAQCEVRSSVSSYTATTTQAITNYIPVLQTASAGQARFDHNPVTRESLGLLVEEQRTNLLLYSAQLGTPYPPWYWGFSTVTSDIIVSPDGRINGDKIEETAVTQEHYIRQSVTGLTTNTTYTVSIFVKAAERTRLRIRALDQDIVQNGYEAFYNLTTGTVINAYGGGAGSLTGTSITPVGNGWYRCAVSGNTGTGTKYIVDYFIGDNSGSFFYPGVAGSGLFLWGAQLEAGAFATSYIPTVAAQVTRNADVANIAGNNFTSWYNASEGIVYIEAQTAATNGGFMTLQDGSVANYMRLNRESGNSKLRLLIEGSSGVQVDIASVANVTVNSFVKGILSYKFNDAAVCLNGESAVTDTSVVLPSTPTELNIGFGKYLTYVNGTIKKLAYYRKRLTNSQLQNLTS